MNNIDRINQAQRDCAIVTSDDMGYGTPFASGYNKGIEKGVKWADTHIDRKLVREILNLSTLANNVITWHNLMDENLSEGELIEKRVDYIIAKLHHYDNDK